MLDLLRFPFMVNALIAGSAVGVVAGASGYVMVCRRSTFAGHALPNIGFAGAAGAVLLGVETVYGLFVITVASAIAMGILGRDLRERDTAIGVLMTFALGMGLLFLALYSGFAQRVYGILFGSVLGISRTAVRVTVTASAVSLAALAALYRPLLFSTFDPELAESRGVPTRLLSVFFLGVLAVIVSLAIQVMGALLLFTLLVGPPATATRLVRSAPSAIALSMALGMAYAALGTLIAGASGILPVSFCIAALSFAVFLPVRLARPVRPAWPSRSGTAGGATREAA